MSKERLWTCAVLGLLTLVVPFLPAMNIFLKVGFVVAERVLYIPSMGHTILAVLVLQQASSLLPQSRKESLRLCLILCLLAFAGKTMARNLDWLSPETLFRSGVLATPTNSRLLYNVGNILQTQNKREESERFYRLAIRYWPLHPEAKFRPHSNPCPSVSLTLGFWFQANVNLGRWFHYEDPSLAEEHYRISLHAKPDFHTAHNHLASVLFERFSNIFATNRNRTVA